MTKRMIAFVTAVMILISVLPIAFASSYGTINIKTETKYDITRQGAAFTAYQGSYEKGGKTYNTNAYAVSSPLGVGARIDLINGGAVYGGGTLTGDLAKYTLSENSRVIGAINGDFFSSQTGIPLGIQIQNGRLLTTNDSKYDTDEGRHSVGFKADGSYVIGVPDIKITVKIGGSTLNPVRLNNRPSYNFVILNSDYADKSYWTDIPHDVLVIKAEGEAKIGASLTGTFEQYLTNLTSPVELKKGYYYLIEPALENTKYLPAAAEGRVQGDAVTVEFTESTGLWKDVHTAIGGGDLLVKDGAVQNPAGYDSAISKSMTSRSAIGFKADGSVVFYTVERDSKAAVSGGMYMDGVAQALVNMGCISAVNLDGGGSATIAAEQDGVLSVKNSYQDGWARRVANSLVLVYTEAPPVIIEDFESAAVVTDRFDGTNLITAEITDGIYYTGTHSLKLDYKLASDGVVGTDFEIKPIITEYSYLSVAVKGDGSGTILEAVFETPYGDVTQAVCTLDFEGWARFNVETDIAKTLKGFNIRSKLGTAVSGTVYIDRIAASADFPLEDNTAPTISASAASDIFTASASDGVAGSGIDKDSFELTVNGGTVQGNVNANVLSADLKQLASDKISLITTEVCDIVGNRARSIDLFRHSAYNSKMPFTDTADNKWDSNYIRYCFENGYISGYPEGNGHVFKGKNNITRAEFCVMLVSRAGLDVSKYTGVTLPYNDVSEIPSWAMLYVKAAYKENIMTGDGIGFNPSDNITRAEAAVAACGIATVDERLSVSRVYTDAASIPNWAAPYIKTATDQRIFDGDDLGAFRPQGLLTRSESAVIMTQITIEM